MSDASIEFACPYCDRISRVPASFAGKQGKCPGCDKVIEVPDPNAPEVAPTVVEPEPIGSRVKDGLAAYRGIGGAPTAPAGGERPCPACGESIKAAAVKCKFCGEFLDGARSRRGPDPDMAARAEEMPNALEWVLCVFCGAIACILGIVYMCQGYTKKGALMIAVPFAMAIFWNILFMVLGLFA
jgi:hypothetical protein